MISISIKKMWLIISPKALSELPYTSHPISSPTEALSCSVLSWAPFPRGVSSQTALPTRLQELSPHAHVSWSSVSTGLLPSFGNSNCFLRNFGQGWEIFIYMDLICILSLHLINNSAIQRILGWKLFSFRISVLCSSVFCT